MSRPPSAAVLRAEPPSPGRGAQARASLIEAAVDVFGERGCDSATTREIAQRSGQNIATIAYHFGNKDGLYRGVAEHIRAILMKRFGPLLDEIEADLAEGSPTPARCLANLQRLLSANIATNREMLAVTSVIVREQTHPTEAFAIFYAGVLERLHRVGAQLMARPVDGDPDSPEFIVRFHALLGESLAFRFARETIIRRAGWDDIGPGEDAIIEAMIHQHAEFLMRGLLAAHRRAPTTPKNTKTRNRPRRKP
jgi:AcrR family transcriptional regulator